MNEETNVAKTLYEQLLSHGAGTWIAVIALSVLGGITNFVTKVRKGITHWMNIPELIGECVIASFVGIVTFLMTDGHVPQEMQAALIAISGHMGTRAIFVFTQMWSAKLSPGMVQQPPGDQGVRDDAE